jgi:hypothetical protein
MINITKEQLKEKQITQIFDSIHDELALITATAKFEYTINKTTQSELNLKLAYIEDTAKLAQLLKTRLNLLWKTTN